ncbi:MAG: ABC transporter substrate-binding protein [Janthinobacterium lividum]
MSESGEQAPAIMSRRRLGALAAAGAMGAGRARAQPARPLTIGVLNDSSGPTADLSGAGASISAELALEDFGPTVLGRPIVLLKADTQAKSDLGIGLARQWYDQGVAAIFDIGITTVAIGVQQLARDKNRLAVFTSTGTVDLTGSLCSPNGIHWTYDSYSVAVGAARANMAGGRKSWFFLTVDYAYGRSLQAEATRYITAQGGQVLGSAPHPLEMKDFSADILKAQASGAALVGLATPTGQIANIVKQWGEFGAASGGRQQLAPIGLFFNDVKGLGLEAAQGLLVTEPFYWDQNEATRAFARRFLARYRRMPNSLQASVYGAVTHYLRAVQQAGTDDTATVVAAMKATPVNDFMTRDGRIRADGRLERDLFVFRVKAPADSTGEWDLYAPVSTIPAAEAFKPADPAVCKLVK